MCPPVAPVSSQCSLGALLGKDPAPPWASPALHTAAPELNSSPDPGGPSPSSHQQPSAGESNWAEWSPWGEQKVEFKIPQPTGSLKTDKP